MRRLAMLLAVFLGGCGALPADRDVVYQVSTLHALMDGDYDGQATIADLARHGDFGIGCFEAMDGEMVLLRRAFYRIRADGSVSPADASDRTPFACVTFFDADQSVEIPPNLDADGFAKFLDGKTETPNLPVAIRVYGDFSSVKTRSVPRQQKPYPKLTEVARNQPTFEFRDVKGTLVGFRLPKYLDGVQLVGYHLHFLTMDRKGGGHVLAFTIRGGIAQVDPSPRMMLSLSAESDFAKGRLGTATKADVEKVERAR